MSAPRDDVGPLVVGLAPRRLHADAGLARLRGHVEAQPALEAEDLDRPEGHEAVRAREVTPAVDPHLRIGEEPVAGRRARPVQAHRVVERPSGRVASAVDPVDAGDRLELPLQGDPS